MIVLYKITNVFNQKAYIGWTSNMKRRWSEHKCPSSQCKHLYRAIKKYGVDNFTREILENCSTETHAKLLEIAVIKGFNTRAPNGYNLTDGGDGAMGRRLSEETKQRLSKIHKGRRLSEEHKQKMIHTGMLGKHHTEETKQKIRAKKIGIHYGTGMLGKKHTEETKQKIRMTKMRSKNKGKL